jgi:Tol biopolymer transport system component
MGLTPNLPPIQHRSPAWTPAPVLAARHGVAFSAALEWSRGERGGRSEWSRPTVLLALLLAMIALWAITPPAPAQAAEPCPNEQLRAESSLNPSTGEPYSLGLPDCRAYEMVSPAEKGGSDTSELPITGIPVSANGQAVGFASQNAYADAENYQVGALGAADNPFLSRRARSGWLTSSAIAPMTIVPNPNRSGFVGDLSPAGFADQTSCGDTRVTNEGAGTSVTCAIRRTGIGSWVASPLYPNTTGALFDATGEAVKYLGSSRNLSNVFFQTEGGATGGGALLPADISTNAGDGIYELEGLGGGWPGIKLVNVETNGNQIGPSQAARLGGIGIRATGLPQKCGSLGSNGAVSSTYDAISESGEVVYFTACPSNLRRGIYSIYARLGGRETVAISEPSPSECTTCEETPASAVFEGASHNGAKAFFITKQQLVNEDADETLDLYEWDFGKPPGKTIVQISRGGLGDLTPGVGANVQGVVRISSDGSHVYFVANGVLTTVPNMLGQVPQESADNLYVYNTVTETTRFVAELCSGAELSGSTGDSQCPATLNEGEDETNDTSLWGQDVGRRAQATPDGRYLVFDTYGRLITSGPQADTDEAQDVYRYDSDTGQLVRVSVGEASFPASNNGNTPGMNALIPAPDNIVTGAFASQEDWSRAISADGSTIVFTTPEQLQANDVDTGSKPSCTQEAGGDTGCDVYEWHEGVVGMVSDGHTAESVNNTSYYGAVGMSASGSDIFFLTRTRLVGQDTDQLVDLYDARINGGFPASPPPEPSCTAGEWTCQGSLTEPPSPLTLGGSATEKAGDNLVAPPFKEVPEAKQKEKRLTCQKKARKIKSAKKKREQALKHCMKPKTKVRAKAKTKAPTHPTKK